MTWAYWRPVFIWTIAWGVTGIALYVSGIFNSPRTGPLWIALAGGSISWSIAGAFTFRAVSHRSSDHWNPTNLLIWALAYLASFTLAGLSSTMFNDTIIGLIIMFIGWSVGAAFGAFASTWFVSAHSKLRRSSIVAGLWILGFFAGSFISFLVAFLAAELAKIFIGFLIGVPAALILGFGLGCALGGFIASAIAVNATRAVTNLV
jgi:hypothetical protein